MAFIISLAWRGGRHGYTNVRALCATGHRGNQGASLQHHLAAYVWPSPHSAPYLRASKKTSAAGQTRKITVRATLASLVDTSS